MKRFIRWTAVFVGGAMFACAGGATENWPQFRGPRGDGVGDGQPAPLTWSATENVVWKTAIAGEGHSSPIVWGGAIFLTSAEKESGRRILLRLDARTGAIVWQKTVVTAPVETMHRENSLASSTPVTDGTHVFTSFQAGDRVDWRCFDFEGNEVWAVQPLAFNGEHGYSYTPVLHGDRLIFDCRQEGEAAVVALDKRTGKVLWRAEPAMKRISHAPPLLIGSGPDVQVVVCGSNEIRSFNPTTGAANWWCKGPSNVGVAGLAYGDGMIFAASGFPVKTRLAVRVDGRGDVSESHVAWSLRKQVPYVPSPVFHAGHLYSIDDAGTLACFDAKTGEAKWDHRLGTGRVRSSLVLAAGRIYATSESGVTTVFAADPAAYRPLASNRLGEFCYTTPAISSGRIYLRTGGHLYCIGGGGAE
ncbi:outer membrane protein assembly factor BamB family protein [Horticoccus sp. 23ND18S-11]|uniref:outer membrane protein assembly factor BamB family protein n=1 Tax=Horticoccus sp. 23ND18S-11 TaxID=3391832 RepID=UPI0039C95056